MQRVIIVQLFTYLLIILNHINICRAAKFPDDGYVNPPPPPKDGYDVPEEGYDAPDPGYDAPEDVKDPCFSYDTDSPLNDVDPAPYAKDGQFGTKDIYECQKLCQSVYDCKFFVFDTRLFSTKCWLKTGKSFILPPVAGTILGPKYCDDGYHAPSDTNIGSPYDAPPPPRDTYEEPDVVPSPPRDTYEEPKDNYEEPDPNYKEPIVVNDTPVDNYQEPEESYKEPDYKGGCFSANTDSPFADLSLPGKPFSKNTNSASDCQRLCQQENNCNYFVFDTKKDWCWLKTNANNQKAELGSTLGPKYCQNGSISPRGNSDRTGRVSFSNAGA